VAQTGEVLENPATGERVVFRRTAADTNGELLEYEFVFRPRGFVAAEHVHTRQTERHEVLAGRVGITVAGRKQVLEPGDAAVVPPGSGQSTTSLRTCSSSCARPYARRS
jgi:mannose-6-phosphate isomerase-like protein (cupin superfamily)